MTVRFSSARIIGPRCKRRSRVQLGDSDRHSTFLGELDGMEQKTGLVFLLTSNAKLEKLDPAMCRENALPWNESTTSLRLLRTVPKPNRGVTPRT